MPHRIWTRPRRPYLQNGKGICRSMILACAPGWEMGFDIVNNFGPYEDKHMLGKAGSTHFTGGSTGGIPTATSYEHSEEYASRSLEDGSPNTSNLEFDFSGSPGFRFQFATFLSVFILARPEDVGNSNCAVFKCRSGGIGAAQNGWDIRFGTGNVWEAHIGDGVTDVACIGTTVTSFGTGPRINSHVGFTWDGANINLYVNGVLDKTQACALNPALVNNTQTPKLFGSGVLNTDIADVTVGMCCAWERVLTRGEISALYSDPFMPWRAADDTEELGAGADYQTYLNVF